MRSWRFVSWLMVSASVFVIAALTAQQRPPDVPYVPTPHEVVREMLRVAQVGKDDVVYDSVAVTDELSSPPLKNSAQSEVLALTLTLNEFARATKMHARLESPTE